MLSPFMTGIRCVMCGKSFEMDLQERALMLFEDGDIKLKRHT